MFTISFDDFFEDPHNGNFDNVEKIMPCFFFQKWLINCKLSKSNKYHDQHVEKTVSMMFLDF